MRRLSTWIGGMSIGFALRRVEGVYCVVLSTLLLLREVDS